jgi:hypothetical protein
VRLAEQDYSAAIAPVGQAPSQAPQSMQAPASTTATPLSRETAPTGQAPSQAPQPTHASETLCAMIILLSTRANDRKRSALARPQPASRNKSLLWIVANAGQKCKPCPPFLRQNEKLSTTCTNKTGIYRQNYRRISKATPHNAAGCRKVYCSSGSAEATTGAGLRTPE